MSFAASLQAHFGHPQYQNDYIDWPINTPKTKRKFSALKNYFLNAQNNFEGVECIHGHFLPFKYLGLKKKKNTAFVTWMRDPVQRMVSHSHYWRRSFDPEKAPPFHRRMVEEDWSIERFCLGKEARNLYSIFLWGFPIDKLDFIGITEFYDEDLQFFSKQFLGERLTSRNENVNKVIGDRYRLEDGLFEEIVRWH